MTSDNYKDALQQAKTDIEVAIRNRDYWTLQIVRLEQLIKSLSQMVATTEKARAKFDALEKALGFTETVNTIIRNSHTPMSAINVRDKLLEMGYDLAYYSNPLGFIHTVLGRLEKQNQIRQTESGLYVSRNSLYEALLALGIPDAKVPPAPPTDIAAVLMQIAKGVKGATEK